MDDPGELFMLNTAQLVSREISHNALLSRGFCPSINIHKLVILLVRHVPEWHFA